MSWMQQSGMHILYSAFSILYIIRSHVVSERGGNSDISVYTSAEKESYLQWTEEARSRKTFEVLKYRFFHQKSSGLSILSKLQILKHNYLCQN